MYSHTHTDSDESPLQSGYGRTTLNTRSSKRATGGKRAGSKTQRLEDSQPVAERVTGKSSVLSGIRNYMYMCSY